MKNCKHCGQDCSTLNKGEYANHVRWCAKNPLRDQYKLDNSERKREANNKKFGVETQFCVNCATCGIAFLIYEREYLFDDTKPRHCSRSCANSKGGTAKRDKLEEQGKLTYRTIAAIHHDIICVVCGESNIVAIHHLDCNHENNDPKNLIPLCPTHHQYYHSKYKDQVEEKINEYLAKKWDI